MSKQVNLNAVWNNSRCAELAKLERLVREVGAINNGGRCLERIAECIKLSNELQRNDFEAPRESFMQFLDSLARRDRFGG